MPKVKYLQFIYTNFYIKCRFFRINGPGLFNVAADIIFKADGIIVLTIVIY